TPDGRELVSGSGDRTVRSRHLDRDAADLSPRGNAAPIIRCEWLSPAPMLYADDSSWHRVVYDLLTGACRYITEFKPDRWDWAIAFPHRPPTKYLEGILTHHGSGQPETVVCRASGDAVGAIPGMYGVTEGHFGALEMHPSGYFWFGYQQHYLCLLQ